MNKHVVKVARPLARLGLSLIENIVGFKSDPTGYEYTRWDMILHKYENFLINKILDFLPDKGVFVDVGANVGYISRQIAEARPKSRQIIAIEPNPRLQSILKYNLSKFSYCRVLNFGLGSKESMLDLYQGYESAIGSFVKGYNETFMSHVSYKVNSISVSVKKGDDILNDLAVIDVIKVDVEGFELEVFSGLSNMMSEGRIKNIFFEFNTLSQPMAGLQEKSIIEYLQSFGYEIYGLEDEWNNVQVDQNNAKKLLKDLGEKGYTTLLAKKR